LSQFKRFRMSALSEQLSDVSTGLLTN